MPQRINQRQYTEAFCAQGARRISQCNRQESVSANQNLTLPLIPFQNEAVLRKQAKIASISRLLNPIYQNHENRRLHQASPRFGQGHD